MNHSVQLNLCIPPQLVDEFLKRLPYVAESLCAYDLNPDTRDTVSFELKPGYDHQSEMVSSRIVEIGDRLCKTSRSPKIKVLLSRQNGDSLKLSIRIRCWKPWVRSTNTARVGLGLVRSF